MTNQTPSDQGGGAAPTAFAAAVLMAALLMTASCGLTGSEQATVQAEPAGVQAERVTAGAEPAGETAAETGDGSDPSRSAGSANGESSLAPGIFVQRPTLPPVPAITLPDLSVLNETGDRVSASLGSLAGDDHGLDIIGAECAAEGGELVYQGSDDGNDFFAVAPDGSGTYDLVHGDDGNVSITVNPDGSGTYDLVHGDEGNLSIAVDADGSGTYDLVHGRDGNVSITVNADGSGTYELVHGNDGNTRIAIDGKGAGQYELVHGDEGNVDVVVNADGSGAYELVHGDDGNIVLARAADGTLVFSHIHGAAGNIELVANPDGSGTYEHVHGEDGNVSIAVDADGNGRYEHTFGPLGNVDVSFTTDIGILDPELVVAGPEPVFFVADRFPPLAKLGSLQPPCVTVIRLDASVLFDFDSDRLRPEALPVVDRVAAALIETGKSLEVHGHTDSKGSDDYNQDLSERRAASFTTALVERGVTTDITAVGYGESRPVAPNEKPDGSDDPGGRQLNRRIEIVIPE